MKEGREGRKGGVGEGMKESGREGGRARERERVTRESYQCEVNKDHIESYWKESYVCIVMYTFI